MRTLHLMWCFTGPRGSVYLFASCVVTQQNATFLGAVPPVGAMIPKFELSRDFCTMHLLQSFIITCLLVRKLSCWQTHPQTNKQMPLKNIQCSSLCYDVGYEQVCNQNMERFSRWQKNKKKSRANYTAAAFTQLRRATSSDMVSKSCTINAPIFKNTDRED